MEYILGGLVVEGPSQRNFSRPRSGFALDRLRMFSSINFFAFAIEALSLRSCLPESTWVPSLSLVGPEVMGLSLLRILTGSVDEAVVGFTWPTVLVTGLVKTRFPCTSFKLRFSLPQVPL